MKVDTNEPSTRTSQLTSSNNVRRQLSSHNTVAHTAHMLTIHEKALSIWAMTQSSARPRVKFRVPKPVSPLGGKCIAESYGFEHAL